MRGTRERDDEVRGIKAVARGAELAGPLVLGREDIFEADTALGFLILFFFFLGLGSWRC